MLSVPETVSTHCRIALCSCSIRVFLQSRSAKRMIPLLVKPTRLQVSFNSLKRALSMCRFTLRFLHRFSFVGFLKSCWRAMLISLLRDGIPWLSANSLMSRSSCSLIRTCTTFLLALKISPAHLSTARIDLVQQKPSPQPTATARNAKRLAYSIRPQAG